MEPFRRARDLLIEHSRASHQTAEVFIAETGADMTLFPTAGHLASWAGVCPGSNESAGRVKSTKTRPGNPYLKGALGVAALSAARSKNTYFSAKYRRIAARRGPMRALVAVEHAMLIAAWNMLTNGEFYRDPGADYYTSQPREDQSPRRQPTRSPRLHRHPHTARRHRISQPGPHAARATGGPTCGHQLGVTSFFVSAEGEVY